MAYWQDQDPDYSLSDWKWAVTNEDTRLGYWEWVFDAHRYDLDMAGNYSIYGPTE
jgi:hypothetical protein